MKTAKCSGFFFGNFVGEKTGVGFSDRRTGRYSFTPVATEVNWPTAGIVYRGNIASGEGEGNEQKHS